MSGSATDEGIMEYTPSISKNGGASAPQTTGQGRPGQFYAAEETIHEAAQAMDDVLDQHYDQLTQQQQRIVGIPRPNSASSSQSSNKRNNHNMPRASVNTASFPNQEFQPHYQTSKPVVQITQQSLVDKMTDKMKQMSDRINALESYKQLCERRILDLDPTHSLPILSGHLGLKSQNHQHADIMQQKLNDMQSQLSSVGELRRRLQSVEDSLRRETLVNEEQRAYINVLREALELKLHQNGLQFKGTSLSGVVIDSNVDGFIQLINSQRAVDQLRLENSQIFRKFNELQNLQERKEQDIIARFTQQLDDLRRQALQEAQDLQLKISSTKDKKRKLKADKNQLLDFVEENVQKSQIEEQHKLRLQQQVHELETRVRDIREERDALRKERDNQEDLIRQTQANVRQMREEKERQGAQTQQLQNQVREMEAQIRDNEDVMRDMDEQVKARQNEIYLRERTIQEKDTECLLARGDAERARRDLYDKVQTLEAFRGQLDDQYLKYKSLQEANSKLQLTLRDTQDELDRFIKQYEGLSQAIAASERDLALCRKHNIDLKRDLDDKSQSLSDYRERDLGRERELQELYAQVTQKDSLMNDCERRLVRSLKDKEQECLTLQKSLNVAESEKRELLQRVEYLERVSKDRGQELQRTKQQMDRKAAQIEDLHRVREEGERTQMLKLNEQERKEIEMSIRVGQAQEELRVLREQKGQAERMLQEKAENVRQQEEEINKREEKLKRWEREMQRLENKAVKESEKSISIQGEYERLRSTRVDDALLIERLRSQLQEIQDLVNELIGTFSTCEHEHLKESISKLKILRSPEDIPHALKSLRHVSSQLIITLPASNRDASPPQRDDTSSNNQYEEEKMLRHFSKISSTQENMRLCIEQLQQERERQQVLKQQLEQLEEQSGNDRLMIADLESVLKRICKLHTLDTQLSGLITDLHGLVRDLNVARCEKTSLTLKIVQQEQKYLTLTKAGGSNQGQLNMLKGQLERDRNEVRNIERQIEEVRRKQVAKGEDIHALDGILVKQTGLQSPQREDYRVHGLKQEVEELRKENRVLQDEKEWNQNRLSEVEEQIGKLKIGNSLRKKSEERSPNVPDRHSSNSNSRLVWPRMNEGRRLNMHLDAVMEPRSLNRDNLSFGLLKHEENNQRRRENSAMLPLRQSTSDHHSAYKDPEFYPSRMSGTPAQRLHPTDETPNNPRAVNLLLQNSNNLDYIPSHYNDRSRSGLSDIRSNDSRPVSAYDGGNSLQDKMNKVKTIFTQIKRNIHEQQQ